MKKIDLLPKFYDNSERDERTKAMKAAAKELLNSDLMPENVKEKVRSVTCDMRIVGDTYSRNYEIKNMNSLITYYNSMTGRK